MDITEKYLESAKIVVASISLFLLSFLGLTAYLSQRTLKYFNDEKFFSEGQRMQPQFDGQIGIFNFEFTYATMNIAWIWMLAVVLIILGSLLKKRTMLLNKLQNSAGEKETDINLLLPLDFLSPKTSKLLSPIVFFSIGVSAVVIVLQAVSLGYNLWYDFRFVESSLVVIGSVYALIALILVVVQYFKRNAHGNVA